MTPLTVGDKAPVFTLTASTGQTISLEALAGKKVVLYFRQRGKHSVLLPYVAMGLSAPRPTAGRALLPYELARS